MPHVSLFHPLRLQKGISMVALYLKASQKNVLLRALKRILINTGNGEYI